MDLLIGDLHVKAKDFMCLEYKTMNADLDYLKNMQYNTEAQNNPDLTSAAISPLNQ